jgi:hypothetical protein
VFAHFAADKLKPYMIVIVLVLFTGFCADKLLLFMLLNRDANDGSSGRKAMLPQSCGLGV